MNAQEVCTFNADNALGLDSDNGMLWQQAPSSVRQQALLLLSVLTTPSSPSL
jgi:hypothetical protein